MGASSMIYAYLHDEELYNEGLVEFRKTHVRVEVGTEERVYCDSRDDAMNLIQNMVNANHEKGGLPPVMKLYVNGELEMTTTEETETIVELESQHHDTDTEIQRKYKGTIALKYYLRFRAHPERTKIKLFHEMEQAAVERVKQDGIYIFQFEDDSIVMLSPEAKKIGIGLWPHGVFKKRFRKEA
jgi:hypothetical protein